MTDILLEKVLEQIKEDIKNGDEVAILDLLAFIPEENLTNYLPEIDDGYWIKN